MVLALRQRNTPHRCASVESDDISSRQIDGLLDVQGRRHAPELDLCEAHADFLSDNLSMFLSLAIPCAEFTWFELGDAEALASPLNTRLAIVFF